MIKCVTQDRKAREKLQIAFRACPDSFDEMQNAIKRGMVSLYEIKAKNHKVIIAGEVVSKDEYFVWAIAGRGAVSALKELAEYLKSKRFRYLSGGTYFAGIERLYKPLNFTRTVAQSGEVIMKMRV